MTDRWIMVRIDRTTRLLLNRCKQRYESEGRAKRTADAYDAIDRFGMSLDSVIRELIRRDESHQSRSRKATQKRREAARVRREEKTASEAAEATSE